MSVYGFNFRAKYSTVCMRCHVTIDTTLPFLNVSLWFLLFLFCLFRVFPHLTFSQYTSIVYLHQTQQQEVSVFPKAVFGFLSLFLLALGLRDRAHFTRRQLTDREDEELEGRARDGM